MYLFQRMRLGVSRFAKEITLTLILKIILIFSLWYFFFSQPIDDSLTDDDVRKKILGFSHIEPITAECLFLISDHFQIFRGEHSW